MRKRQILCEMVLCFLFCLGFGGIEDPSEGESRGLGARFLVQGMDHSKELDGHRSMRQEQSSALNSLNSSTPGEATNTFIQETSNRLQEGTARQLRQNENTLSNISGKEGISRNPEKRVDVSTKEADTKRNASFVVQKTQSDSSRQRHLKSSGHFDKSSRISNTPQGPPDSQPDSSEPGTQHSSFQVHAAEPLEYEQPRLWEYSTDSFITQSLVGLANLVAGYERSSVLPSADSFSSAISHLRESPYFAIVADQLGRTDEPVTDEALVKYLCGNFRSLFSTLRVIANESSFCFLPQGSSLAQRAQAWREVFGFFEEFSFFAQFLVPLFFPGHHQMQYRWACRQYFSPFDHCFPHESPAGGDKVGGCVREYRGIIRSELVGNQMYELGRQLYAGFRFGLENFIPHQFLRLYFDSYDDRFEDWVVEAFADLLQSGSTLIGWLLLGNDVCFWDVPAAVVMFRSAYHYTPVATPGNSFVFEFCEFVEALLLHLQEKQNLIGRLEDRPLPSDAPMFSLIASGSPEEREWFFEVIFRNQPIDENREIFLLMLSGSFSRLNAQFESLYHKVIQSTTPRVFFSNYTELWTAVNRSACFANMDSNRTHCIMTALIIHVSLLIFFGSLIFLVIYRYRSDREYAGVR